MSSKEIWSIPNSLDYSRTIFGHTFSPISANRTTIALNREENLTQNLTATLVILGQPPGYVNSDHLVYNERVRLSHPLLRAPNMVAKHHDWRW